MKRLMHSLLLIILSIAAVASCTQKMDKENKKAATEGLKNSEIKRVSEAEIIDNAFSRGRLIADTAQLLLGKTLKSTINAQGVEAAIQYCNISSYPLLESLSKKYGADIKRASLRLRNPKDAPDEIESEILEAYQYSLDQGLAINDNVQIIDDSYLLYTKPIMMGDPVCLNCHGEVGDEVTETTYSKIMELYPEDNALNHKTGDLRGIWSIKLDKASIVRDL